MSFYCVYCNRNRSGRKNTPEEKTDEHFIPKSIGGRWKIKICAICNQRASKTCDTFFAQIAWTYELYRTGIARMHGFAELKDSRIVAVYFKHQTTEKGHYQLHWCRDLKTFKIIPTIQIKSIIFQPQHPTDVIATHPAVAKMALGAAYYLVRRYNKWIPSIESVFTGLAFADLRRLFLQGHFRVSGKGIGHGAVMKSLTSRDAETLLRSRVKPSTRRHYIAIDDYRSFLRITMCLYSMYFWQIYIPGITFGIEKMETEVHLTELSAVNPAKAANLMHHDGKWCIKIIV